MLPSEELASKVLRDRVTLDESGEQAFAEEPHHRIAVPDREGLKSAILGKATVGQEEVSVRMPLDQISGGGNGDDDAGPSVRAELSAHVLSHGLRGTLREVEEELPTLARRVRALPFAAIPPTTAASSSHMTGRSSGRGKKTGRARSSGTWGTKVLRSHGTRFRT
jgi:hypothetical protein